MSCREILNPQVNVYQALAVCPWTHCTKSWVTGKAFFPEAGSLEQGAMSGSKMCFVLLTSQQKVDCKAKGQGEQEVEAGKQ